MDSYKAYIDCECSEHMLIDAFNFLDAVFHSEHGFRAGSGWTPSFTFRLLQFGGRYQRHTVSSLETSHSQAERLLSFEPDDLDRTQIVLTVTVEDDTDLDVFAYRYFFLIMNNLLRKQDRAYLDCPDTYYHKVGSYFFLQTLSQTPVELLRRGSRGEEKKLPQKFSLSSEWLPAIYLPSRNSELYEVLANPLFKSVKRLKTALQTSVKDGGRLDFSRDGRLQYISCLERYFTGWLNGMLSELEITERLYSTPGISQLLFALLCGKLWGQNSQPSLHDAEKLLEICCDFGDCILQVAENIVSHTQGGVLSVRINDNWDKIKDAFQAKDREHARWYMRISLVDFSRGSILDNVKGKSGIGGLTLSHIFMEPETPSGILREDYQRVAKTYEGYLNNSEQIIHHYGLAVFRNVVNQYGGCFTVKSSARSSIAAEEWYAPDSERIVYNGVEENALHIPGSEYDILLPLDKRLLEDWEQPSNPSVLLKPKYIVSSVSRSVVFEEKISNHFNGPLSDVVRAAKNGNVPGYQQMKEQVVKESARNLADKLLSKGPGIIENSVFYFYLSDITERVFGRTEIVAKVILQVIADLKTRTGWQDDGQEWLYLVLYGLSESKLVQFTRQFALFYHRSEGNRLMRKCQLYVVSENYQAEVMFAGVRLSVISDYCRSRRLVTGTSLGISDLLAHIAGREEAAAGNREEIEAFPFELLDRMEWVKQPQDGEQVVRSKHNKWYHKNLETVLKNDIHGGDLGCCLRDVHVRVGGVHLNTFYEGQLLFANLYWYQIFAHYICEAVLTDKKIDKDEDILLYGYETYSEQMLFAATQKLREKGRRVYYAVFENPKYITAAELSEQRVRYVEQLLDAPVQNLCVVYLYGIGTTLTTISQKMNAQLEHTFQKREKKELLDRAYKKGMVIVQISDSSRIQCDRENHTVSSQTRALDFLTDKKCNYLMELQTKWHPTKECPLCLRATSYLDEQPLIQTNETSTVPMILIKPKQRAVSKIRFKQAGSYTQSFLQNPDSAEYLYYCHLNRSENHYQFYVRTAALLNDYLQRDNEQLYAWFQEIRAKEVESVRKKGAHQINIIVSPQHFSNESLVAAVNDRVFGGEAYIINFDVKKEFRDSFVAKFQNYRSALEMLRQGGGKVNLELNFYFVDDIILTGNTFNRAKSLISSMLGEFAGLSSGDASGISINLFKGIILLVNRNSKQTMCNYFVRANLKTDEDGYLLLPVYAFIELNTPAIRSYGDSCPICNKLARIQTLGKESALTYVERHWREKETYHSLKKLSDAKADRIKKNSEHQDDEFYRTRGLRRMQCSEAVWALLKDGGMTRENAREILENEINSCLCQLSRPEERVEYLISYLKIISREHAVFQEMVQPAAFQILLSIFSAFIEKDGGPDRTLCRTVRTLIQDPGCPNLAYALYQIIIARLCTMGSTVFCRREQLEACLEKGLALEERIRPTEGKSVEPFSEFLCIQIKKMLFVTQDCASRVDELQHLLEHCIQDELEKGGEAVEEKLGFFASMYLESVCDETRVAFLKNWESTQGNPADKVGAFRGCIETEDYSSLIKSFRELMGAKKAVMFQIRTQDDLTMETEYRNITVLTSSQEEERIDILRSELLEFYRNHDPDGHRPFSRKLLDVKDTARVVLVGREQKDPAVQNYVRRPCTIAYARLDYTDRLHSNEIGRIFFAFFYPEEQSNDLMEVLKHLQGFLSFRHNLKQRIEKDFNGNLFGKRTEEAWRIDWLSIEKAGAHTDSSGVHRLINQRSPKNNEDILDTLFGSTAAGPEDSSQLLKLTYNILIAMYFRAVISDREDQFASADNIESGQEGTYSKVSDLIQFSEKNYEGLKLRFGNGQKAEEVNNALLYGAYNTIQSQDGKNSYTGLPAPKQISFRSKYLQAFLVDILCNIETYGAKDEYAEIYIEDRPTPPGYLVFQNQVVNGSDDPEGWCREENYKLKQSIEFDHVETSIPKGFSLGCIAHCMRWAGELMASYSCKDGKTYFTIKLPMIQSRKEEGTANGQATGY